MPRDPAHATLITMIARTHRLWKWLSARWHGAAAKYKVLVKYAALAGVAVAVICHFVPQDYKQICDAVAALCGG